MKIKIRKTGIKTGTGSYKALPGYNLFSILLLCVWSLPCYVNDPVLAASEVANRYLYRIFYYQAQYNGYRFSHFSTIILDNMAYYKYVPKNYIYE
ncbi:MAG: hypothetical protein PHE49_09410 [bacterium]|nr:hypothetical protein [bacterium]